MTTTQETRYEVGIEDIGCIAHCETSVRNE